jgi:hypothetical protein
MPRSRPLAWAPIAISRKQGSPTESPVQKARGPKPTWKQARDPHELAALGSLKRSYDCLPLKDKNLIQIIIVTIIIITANY